MDYFPYEVSAISTNKGKKDSDILASVHILGRRFHSDQTLYEYLIEFLCIFCATKQKGEEGAMHFHNVEDYQNGTPLCYGFEPRMALRRFIFYDKYNKKMAAPVDGEAYDELLELLKSKMSDIGESERNTLIEDMQDLLQGFTVVTRNRAWCAKNVMPICKEMVFCEAMPKFSQRKGINFHDDDEKTRIDIDKLFDFDKHNFLARGGELYYMHLLQAMENQQEKRKILEKELNYMLTIPGKQISKIANFIQNTWEDHENVPKKVFRGVSNSYLYPIPSERYQEAGKHSLDELICFLSNSIDPIKRIELLAQGMMFQVMRMMSDGIYDYLGQPAAPWIVDMKGDPTNNVKSIAASEFKTIENAFMTALNREEDRLFEKDDTNKVKDLMKSRKETLYVFRAKGKELDCIIPMQGGNERFTLSEEVTTFLILSLIKPGDRMTLDMFLQKLYENYHIVIGPEEYKKAVKDDAQHSKSLSHSFVSNVEAFRLFLRNIGFLRELSDSTSLVVNPYTSLDLY